MTSVTVMVPITIRRRGGRKRIIGPDGAPVRASDDGAAGLTETRGDPALVKALARAFRWLRMLEDGRYASIRDLAAAEGVDRAYVGRLLKLTLMAPEMVEAVLDGRDTDGLNLKNLLGAEAPIWRGRTSAGSNSWSPVASAW